MKDIENIYDSKFKGEMNTRVGLYQNVKYFIT